ncbi:MAG TPA: hypothetical protein GXX49_01900 [Clostridiaceae bacterium]|nr:hypothetical protein [Clostridiaceae bacterium]
MESSNKEYKELKENEVFEDFFTGFKTSRVSVNAVAFLCVLQPREDSKDIKSLKDNLKKSLLEISDGLSKVGLPLPIFAIIECKEKQNPDKEIYSYNKWHEIAGDQDWHRGDFSIIPCIGNDDAEKMFEQLMNPIFSSELTYNYREFTLKDFAEYFERKFAEIEKQKSPEEKIKSILYKVLSNKFKDLAFKSTKAIVEEAVAEALDTWRSEINKMIEMPEIDKI